MEQHPVPRNISSFQFHLIGDMTIRQFGYLATGAFIGFLIVKYAPLNGLFKWPLAALPFFSGLAFAFLPIQERPLDKWLVAFIRSINSPTQYLWQKDAYIPGILLKNYSTNVKPMPASHQVEALDAKKKLDSYLSSLPTTPHQTINIRESNYVNRTLELFSSVDSGFSGNVNPGLITPGNNQFNSPTRPVKIDMPRPTISDIKTTPIKIQAAEEIKPIKEEKTEIKEIKTQPVIQTPVVKPIQPIQPVAPIPAATSIPAPTIKQTQVNIAPPVEKAEPVPITVKTADDDKIKKMIAEKQQLEVELAKLKDELTAKKEDKNIIKPTVGEEKKPTIKTVTPKSAVNEIGIPKLPQVANIIMGVIKDRDNKLLPNIILTIKDLNDIPHRALKTNRLGQFSTATPLTNGTYHIEAEDPLKRYVFDIAEINLNGKIFLPIEIDAKGEKELMREKLTKEIFGSQTAASI